MWILEDLCRELSDEMVQEYVVDTSAPCITPVEIAFDYHAAWFINSRMLHERGWGTGARKGTVVHAVADREIGLSRTVRKKGESLCGASRSRKWSGDMSSTPDSVSCPKCSEIVQRLGLNCSIKHKFGAWT